MGTFSVSIEVGDPQGGRFVAVDALVETGASYMVIPRLILADLGVIPVERRPFTLADGRLVEYEVGLVSLRLNGRSFPVLCVFGEEGAEPLLGAVALETFGLAADPVGHRLILVPGRLMGFAKGHGPLGRGLQADESACLLFPCPSPACGRGI